MAYTWRPTAAPVDRRYDDIWFISPQIGWGVNSAGQIVHTEDAGATWTIQHTVAAGTYLRCMSFTSPTDGWVGSITQRQRLWRTVDGKTWIDMTANLPPLPSAICGISSPSKGVVFASGTQYPDREAAIMHTADGGQTWESISMAEHANLLIDTYFIDDLQGWVVGGKGGTTLNSLTPVIMFTADGGKTWQSKLQDSGIDFPIGEWGWKIQFLTPQIGFVSLENYTAAAILKTTDGGQSWNRIPISGNVRLQGVGFVNEQVGWVGGWGQHDLGTTSGTTDGGSTWFDTKDDVGHFINRFRFTKAEPIVAYASGGMIDQCSVTEGAALAAASRVLEPPIPKAWETLDITTQVPQNAKQLTITIFDQRQTLKHVLTDESSPLPGERTFSWNFKTADGLDAGTGHFMYRIRIDGRGTAGIVVRPARTTPDALGVQVVDLIERFARRAKCAHDHLALPDANGRLVSLKSLFDKPLDLMVALIRGGWIIPGEPDRSMFLAAIIKTGPMQRVIAQNDIRLLSDWIETGAHVPETK